jgi:hypothetical protein
LAYRPDFHGALRDGGTADGRTGRLDDSRSTVDAVPAGPDDRRGHGAVDRLGGEAGGPIQCGRCGAGGGADGHRRGLVRYPGRAAVAPSGRRGPAGRAGRQYRIETMSKDGFYTLRTR